MKYSNLFGKTEREAKRGMQATSHKLLYQGGYVRELSAGRYEFLPLGFRVWRKIVDIIDEEMERIGSQRFSIPILQPMEFWKKTNRDTAFGKELMRIKDRNNKEFALSATGEGVVTEMISGTNPTYKDLPIIIHQFIVKLRDEKRPRGGILRTREFVMKDAYSYHESESDFMKTYKNFADAYGRICRRFGLKYYACIADSGALGGDYCHEFQVPCGAGEDHIVKCDKCDYAANNEKSEFMRKDVNKKEKKKKFKMIALPNKVATIKQLMDHYNLPAERFIKNVVYKTEDGRLVIGTIRGDLDVNEFKLARAAGVATLEKATDDDLKEIGAKPGFVHSWGYEKYKDKIIFVSDTSIIKAKNLYGGYKTDTKDPINVNYKRDFESDKVTDIAEPYDGAKCAKCKDGKLKLIRTLEFGHIFKYDHFYTKHHNGSYTDKDGKKKLMYMGAYGIGIGRAMAAIVETCHDKDGIIWPITVAPFQIHLLSFDENDNIESKAKGLYTKLLDQGLDILWDDRKDMSAGVKLKDADLLGIPIRLVVSKKSLSKDGIEIKLREEENAQIVDIGRVIDILRTQIDNLKKKYRVK